MKKRIIGIFLIMILCMDLFSVPVLAEEFPDELKNLYARSAVLMDADSGRILFGKKEDEVLPMASTTKIMTCILALENMKTGQICEVSEYAVRQPKVHLGMKKGEKYLIEDLFYSLMLESHNDSAVVIAETIAGSVENFAVLMNNKAQEIGCTDTYFITPNGLDAEDDIGVHSTTAKDLALIMRYCIQESKKKNDFLEITQKSSYQFSDLSGKRSFICTNHNAFLEMMDGALSGKTGFTNDAGYCYVGALRQGKRTFIVALLACGWPNNKGYKWKDTRKLMQYGLDNYEYHNIQEEIKPRIIYVEDGWNNHNPLQKEVYVKTRIVSKNQSISVLMRAGENVEVKMIYRHRLKAPIEEGKQVGTVYYILDEKVIREDRIITKYFVDHKSVQKYAEYLWKLYVL